MFVELRMPRQGSCVLWCMCTAGICVVIWIFVQSAGAMHMCAVRAHVGSVCCILCLSVTCAGVSTCSLLCPCDDLLCVSMCI